MNIILYGFKRVGKTTYGKKLAQALKCPFLDTDDLIVENYVNLGYPKKEVHEIHHKLGNSRFRALEEQMILGLHTENFVIAVGGGAVLSKECQVHLKKLGKLVYLTQDRVQTKKNLASGRIPNFLDPANFDASFDQMYAKRDPIYKNIADYSLDLSQLQEDEVVSALIKKLSFKKTSA